MSGIKEANRGGAAGPRGRWAAGQWGSGAVLVALLSGCGSNAGTSIPAPVHYTVVHVDSFPSLLLNEQRVLDVYLPPGYDSLGSARYPVLYMNDGQDASALGLLPTLDSLTASRHIPPLIVVAIHANDQRMQDYGTAGTPNAQGFGARAHLYERFVLEEMMPWTEQHYRVRRGPDHTAVFGSSLGGLAAFDIAWRHPEVFGTVGAMSGSFWWRTQDGTPEQKQASRVALTMVREATPLPRLRIWLQTADGDETSDRDGNGVIDSIQDTADLVDALVARGYVEGKDVVHVTVEGGHDQATWGAALPGFLEWAF